LNLYSHYQLAGAVWKARSRQWKMLSREWLFSEATIEMFEFKETEAFRLMFDEKGAGYDSIDQE
jgi:hypothetical protein